MITAYQLTQKKKVVDAHGNIPVSEMEVKSPADIYHLMASTEASTNQGALSSLSAVSNAPTTGPTVSAGMIMERTPESGLVGLVSAPRPKGGDVGDAAPKRISKFKADRMARAQPRPN